MKKVGVIGAGTMGQGIANAFATNGYDVTVCDLSLIHIFRGSATSELIFNNVRLSKDQLLGQEGKGFKIAMMTLDGGRIGIAAQALGIAQGAIDEVVPYVKSRKQFGRPISKFQNTQFQLADMQVKTDAARLLVYQAAMAKDCLLYTSRCV